VDAGFDALPVDEEEQEYHDEIAGADPEPEQVVKAESKRKRKPELRVVSDDDVAGTGFGDVIESAGEPLLDAHFQPSCG